MLRKLCRHQHQSCQRRLSLRNSSLRRTLSCYKKIKIKNSHRIWFSPLRVKKKGEGEACRHTLLNMPAGVQLLVCVGLWCPVICVYPQQREMMKPELLTEAWPQSVAKHWGIMGWTHCGSCKSNTITGWGWGCGRWCVCVWGEGGGVDTTNSHMETHTFERRGPRTPLHVRTKP